MQALQIHPDNVKLHYRLAQAYLHLGQYQQCLVTCQAALEIKPGAKQLRQLCQLAADMTRITFMTDRTFEIDQAITTVQQAAHQQVSQQLHPKRFCHHIVQTYHCLLLWCSHATETCPMMIAEAKRTAAGQAKANLRRQSFSCCRQKTCTHLATRSLPAMAQPPSRQL